MARRVRSAKLETRSARLRLAVRKKPYAVKIMRGLHLLYRRNKTAGTWIVRVTRGGEDWTGRLGMADDYDAANGKNILTYDEASSKAKTLAGAGRPTTDDSVKAALDDYQADLEGRDKDPENVRRVLAHLPAKLAGKMVATLTDDDLKPFHDALLAAMKRNSAKRTIKAFKAALNFVADRDRITHRPWTGPALKIDDSSDPAHNVILDDDDRRAVRAAMHRDNEEFGLFGEILDETGARPSQVARLTADNVQTNFVDPQTRHRAPRLMMPVSRKGRGKKQVTHRAVPISEALANKLGKLKARDGLLFKDADGTSWLEINLPWRFASAIEGVRFNNSAKVTMYALRHTSIVRQLLAGLPTAVVARLHDTSTAMIEKHYSAYIADHTDALARSTLPKPAKIIPLRKGLSEAPA